MTTRRMTSRQVALTAAFLALAAGGTAACDATPDDDVDYYSAAGDTDPYAPVDEEAEADQEEQTGDEVFYCADEEGEVVDEDNCDDGGTSSYFLWHSPHYSHSMKPGMKLKGGDYFLPGDRAARRAFALPKTGRVGNGTVKTNVVGAGSSGSGSTSGSGSNGSSNGSSDGSSDGGSDGSSGVSGTAGG